MPDGALPQRAAEAGALPLFGLVPGAIGRHAQRDLRERAQRVLHWRGSRPGTWVEIEVAPDALGQWAARWSWSIGADLGAQTGTVGGACPFTGARWPTREAAAGGAAATIEARLPAYRGTAGREVAAIRRQLQPLTQERIAA